MRKLGFVMILIALFSATLACGFSASTANIGNAFMTRDPKSTEATTAFAQDEVFYAIVDLKNAPDDTVVKAVWSAVEVEGVEPNTVIDQAELKTGSGQVTFNLTPDGIWPVGSYKVDLYLNDDLKKTLEFQVQ